MNTPMSPVLRLPNSRTTDALAAAFRRGHATVEDNPHAVHTSILIQAAASPILLVSAPWLAVQAELSTPTALPLSGETVRVLVYLLAVMAALGILVNAFLIHLNRHCVTVPADEWEARVWAGTVRLLASCRCLLDDQARAAADDDLEQLYDELRTHYETFTLNGTRSPSAQHRAEALACRVAEVCSRTDACVTDEEPADCDSPGEEPAADGQPVTATI